ncbi:MAG TPA: hypothetical protein VGI67_02750 [Thermoleophilaceae bacterium]|jgi:hypothetical protein
MTDEERQDEAAEEEIEDLEAPAAAQEDVAGGANECIFPSCHNPNTRLVVMCRPPSCSDTTNDCLQNSHALIVHEM